MIDESTRTSKTLREHAPLCHADLQGAISTKRPVCWMANAATLDWKLFKALRWFQARKLFFLAKVVLRAV